MKFTILILLLCLSVASSRYPESGKHCLDDVECIDGQTCMEGSCYYILGPLPKKCEWTKDCNKDEYCTEEARCVTALSKNYPNERHCYYTSDCNRYDYCKRGLCTTSPNANRFRRCNATQDCNAKDICAGGWCREDLSLRCFNNTDCTGGQTCVTGACIYLSAEKPRKCKTILDCYEGEVCSEHKLCDKVSFTTTIMPPKVNCSDNSDCDHDKFCVRGLCSEIIERMQRCKSTQDCDAGESCNAVGWCRVASSLHCSKNSDCHFGECKTAPDCDAGDFCDFLGQCDIMEDQPKFEPTLCSDNSECTGGESCIEGHCTIKTFPQPKRCKSTQDCKKGEVCGDNGRCNDASSIKSPGGIVYGEPPIRCSENSGCNDGEVCNNRGRCVTSSFNKDV
ncbi:hypothetical protein CAEBREN_19040 [Caenorhabditis brenneri]|uniref:Tenascin-X n=1 Tax=Caenorhabditis brenneri TaxID=135651 RepID=G0NBY5_CAEBE|nr:hypothetical protein CAEBREN_19040 [Caenorhabditis brenneri]